MKDIVLLNKIKRCISGFFFLYLLSGNLSAQAGSEAYSTLYNEAIKQIEQKNYAGARNLLDKAVILKHDYAEALFARGACNLMLEEWDKACPDFENSAKLNWKPAIEYLEKYCGKNSYGRSVNRSKK
jgi:tetratricopeptide (TPR) repeat protein